MGNIWSYMCICSLGFSLIGCSTIYAKPQIRCEAGKNTGNGNNKSDCWAYGEVGVTITPETFKDMK